jgi:hypothetical protein
MYLTIILLLLAELLRQRAVAQNALGRCVCFEYTTITYYLLFIFHYVVIITIMGEPRA